MLTNMKKYIICPNCHAVNAFKECFEVGGP